jgi:phage terminase large subunit GpA-like protein
MQPLHLEPRILARLRPAEELTVSQWADKHRILDPRFSAEPGAWRTDRAPYAREWMDSASCEWVRRVAVVASTQVGKTEALNNVLGYLIAQHPSPVMFVAPRDPDVRTAYARRIMPMIESSPVLRAELTSRKRDAKANEIAFRRSVVYLRGAHSPAELASVSARAVLGDELDKWPRWSGREANPLALVESRVQTFLASSLIFSSSTPTTRAGLIQQEFEDGDRRRFFVPCPHCGELDVLKWGNLHWDRERVKTSRDMRTVRESWFACVACGARIDEAKKSEMLAGGVWVPEGRDAKAWRDADGAADRTSFRSYHIWAAYSPWLPWNRIVETFLRAQERGPAEMQNFVNQWLAEVWEERVGSIANETVAASIDTRDQHEVPIDGLVLIGAVDVQVDRLEWVLSAYGNDEESWVVAAGKATTWEELDDVFFRNAYGPRQLTTRCVVIDSRYRRDEVLDWVRKNQPVARMIAGVERADPIPFATRRIDRHPKTGAILPNALTIWTVNVALFKDLIAERLERAVKAPGERRGRIHLPKNLAPEWLAQIDAEHKIAERSGKRVVQRWVLRPNRQRNEAWDLLVYLAAAARLVRVDTLRSDSPPPPPPPVRVQKPKRRRDELRWGGHL